MDTTPAPAEPVHDRGQIAEDEGTDVSETEGLLAGEGDGDDLTDGVTRDSEGQRHRQRSKTWMETLCCEAEDIKFAVKEASNRYTLLAMLVAFLASYYAVIGRHSLGSKTTRTVEGVSRNTRETKEFVQRVRSLPSATEIEAVKSSLIHSMSSIGVSTGENITLSMMAKAHPQHGHSHMRLPREWYDCVHIGISTWDLVNPNSTSLSQKAMAPELLKALQALKPVPTAVLPWVCAENATEWHVEGWAARFCYDHLREQGALGSGVDKARWTKVSSAVERVARQFEQLLVVQWYSYDWGHRPDDDPDRHSSVLQEVVPVRSGLQSLRTSGVAYRKNADLPPPEFVRVKGKRLT